MTRAEYEKIFTAAGKALKSRLGFNPEQTVARLRLFPLSFYRTEPEDIPEAEREDWHYMRDYMTKAALLFNAKTGEVRLLREQDDWTPDLLADYRKSSRLLRAEETIEAHQIREMRKSKLYQDMRPLMQERISAVETARGVGGEHLSAHGVVTHRLTAWKNGGRADVPDDIEATANLLLSAYFEDEREENVNWMLGTDLYQRQLRPKIEEYMADPDAENPIRWELQQLIEDWLRKELQGDESNPETALELMTRPQKLSYVALDAYEAEQKKSRSTRRRKD